MIRRVWQLIAPAVWAPLLVFVEPLSRARRDGLNRYRHLAKRHLDEFEAKWLHGGAADGELLVGNPDVSSLTDMASSFDVLREMRVIPVTRDLIVQLVIMTLLPIAPSPTERTAGSSSTASAPASAASRAGLPCCNNFAATSAAVFPNGQVAITTGSGMRPLQGQQEFR